VGRPLSVRIGEHKLNLKNGLLDKSKLAQHAFKKVIRYPGMKPRFYKLKSTVDRENTKNLPTWLVWKTL
jgi:hypothetical protein